MNNYELFGVIVKVVWLVAQVSFLTWATIYGVELVIGGVQYYKEKEKTK